MDKEQILRMAREAGMVVVDDQYSLLPFLERFAELVRKDYSTTHANIWLERIRKFILEERKACAQVCYRHAAFIGDPIDQERIFQCAAAIRARGNT